MGVGAGGESQLSDVSRGPEMVHVLGEEGFNRSGTQFLGK